MRLCSQYDYRVNWGLVIILMEEQISVKTTSVDIKNMVEFLSHQMTKNFYEDRKKTQEENIDLIISLVKDSLLNIDVFLSDKIKCLKNKGLKSGLIRYMISVKFGVDIVYKNRYSPYIRDVTKDIVLIQFPAYTIAVTIDGKVKIPGYKYILRVLNDNFICAYKVFKREFCKEDQAKIKRMSKVEQYKLLYYSEDNYMGVFSSKCDEIIPCGYYRIKGNSSMPYVKVWNRDIGYLLYPISKNSYEPEEIENIKEDYCFSEWIIRDDGGNLYRLTLSDCYLSEWSMYEPNEYAQVYDVDLVTDCAYDRPWIYNLDRYEYCKRMEKYSQDDIKKLLEENANELTKKIGFVHIIPKDELDKILSRNGAIH